MFSLLVTGSYCQTNDMKESETLPYHQIPKNPDTYSAGGILSRMVDGLGYRFYWATEGLRKEDIEYRPSEDAQSVAETMDHFYGLSLTILNVSTSTPNKRPLDIPELSFEEKRALVLKNLKKASENFLAASDESIENMKVIFQRGEQSSEFPLWNIINGPIADAIYHTGQIVSFRRTNGNPINSKVNVFIGKNRE